VDKCSVHFRYVRSLCKEAAFWGVAVMTQSWEDSHFDVTNPDLGLLMPDCPAELSIQVSPRSHPLFNTKYSWYNGRSSGYGMVLKS